MNYCKSVEKVRLSFGELTFTLYRKNVRRINLRIDSGGSVSVSANPKVSLDSIKKFIKDNGNFVYKGLTRAEKEKAENSAFDFNDGETVRFFGKDYVFKIQKGATESVKTENGLLILTAISDEKTRVKKVFAEFVKAEVEKTVLGLCKTAYKDYEKYCAGFPEIKFKKTVSRWGSCNYSENVLTFSYYLYAVNPECCKYVVYHEFTHFIVHDHSAKFYAALNNFYPNFYAARKVLKKEKIRKQILV